MDFVTDFAITATRIGFQLLFMAALAFVVLWPFDKGLAKGVGQTIAFLAGVAFVLAVFDVGITFIALVGR